MEIVRSKSLKEKRAEKNLPEQMEQEITELELENIEQEQNMTDMELDILELQQKIAD